MKLLTINTGSSSVRLALYEYDAAALRRLVMRIYPCAVEPDSTLREFVGSEAMRAIAHRVVHGGERLSVPCIIDVAVEREIERLSPLAPLHNPRALAWIRACRALWGNAVAQVAVFDTGFYAHLPEVARAYALPRALVAKHALRRYGFHGIAHQAMWRRWRALHPEVHDARVISLQLGAGCSITAVRDGRAVDTSMGFSPLEGLVMATRAGDVDVGLLLYLQREGGMTVDVLDDLLNRESGLYGLAGDSDMRTVLASSAPDAQLAIELYCYRARKYIGAYLAALGGADAILFGGGVGEHAAAVRARMLTGLEWAGIVLDPAANAGAGERRINAAESCVEVWVMPVDESAILAAEAHARLSRARC